MSDLTIRAIELEDLEAISAIEQQAHISPWSINVFQSSLSERHHNYALLFDNKIVGYYVSHFIAGELSLENICIAVEQQGKGFAKKLMQHLLSQAQRLKADSIWLEVRASNLSAIKLYEHFSFRVQGIRKKYYKVPNSNTKEDAVLMSINVLEEN